MMRIDRVPFLSIPAAKKEDKGELIKGVIGEVNPLKEEDVAKVSV